MGVVCWLTESLSGVQMQKHNSAIKEQMLKDGVQQRHTKTFHIRININVIVTFLASSAFSLCSVLPFTFRRTSSMSGRFLGPFFFFSLAKIEDSLSGNAGISSKTVACRQVLVYFASLEKNRQILQWQDCRMRQTRMSVLAIQLSRRYSTALCWSSTSAFRSWLFERRTPWIVAFTSGNKLINLMQADNNSARVGTEHRWNFECRRLNWTRGLEKEGHAGELK